MPLRQLLELLGDKYVYINKSGKFDLLKNWNDYDMLSDIRITKSRVTIGYHDRNLKKSELECENIGDLIEKCNRNIELNNKALEEYDNLIRRDNERS